MAWRTWWRVAAVSFALLVVAAIAFGFASLHQTDMRLSADNQRLAATDHQLSTTLQQRSGLVYVCTSPKACRDGQEFQITDPKHAPSFAVGLDGGASEYGDCICDFAPHQVYVPAVAICYTSLQTYDRQVGAPDACEPGQAWIGPQGAWACEPNGSWRKTQSW